MRQSLSELEISLGFSNIAIKQKKNKVKSRSKVTTGSLPIRGVYLPIPMIAANMSTVTNADFCIKLSSLGALGVMHRAADNETLIKEVCKIAQSGGPWTAASVGIGQDQYELAGKLIVAGANIIFIDVAHGYCDEVIDLGKRIKDNFNVKVVVGNTTNPDMVDEVYEFADAIKVGIAQGLACETSNTAGCTEKQFSAVWNVAERAAQYGIPVISDGGTREPADMVKAIGAGANSIMAGSIFARCPESAAETVKQNEVHPFLGTVCVMKKVYSGMASRAVQEQWKGQVSNDCPEGKTVYLDVGEPVDKLLERYSGALRSGITYSGASCIKEFQEKVEFVKLV